MKAQQASRRLVLTSRGRVLCFGGMLAVFFGLSSGVSWLWLWGGMLVTALAVAGLSCWRLGRSLNGPWQWSWPVNWIEGEERVLLLRYEGDPRAKKSPTTPMAASLELELAGQAMITWSLQTTADGEVKPQRVRLLARHCAVVELARLRSCRVEAAGCVILRQEWRWLQPGVILPRAELPENVVALFREAMTLEATAKKWQHRDGMRQVDWRGSSRSWARTRELMRRVPPQKAVWTLVLHSYSALPSDPTPSAWLRHVRAALALVDRALSAGLRVTVRCPTWHEQTWCGNVRSDLPTLAQRLLLLSCAAATTWDELRRQLNAVPATDALWVLSDQETEGWSQRCLALSHLRLQPARSWQQPEEEHA